MRIFVVLFSIHFLMGIVTAYAQPGVVAPSLTSEGVLNPLLGSDWAIRNPGLLPFSKCGFLNGGRVWGSNFGIFDHQFLRWDKDSAKMWQSRTELGAWDKGFVVGTSKIEFNLFACVSHRYRLAFVLPIRMDRTFEVPSFKVFGSIISKVQFDPRQLHGKVVSDLLKPFNGGACGLACLVGGSASLYENSAGITMSVSRASFGLQAELGYSRTTLQAVNREYVSQSNRGSDLYLLTDSTTGHQKMIESLDELAVTMNASGNPQLRLGEMAFVDQLPSRDLSYLNNSHAIAGSGHYQVKTTLPAGFLAGWNGSGYEINYSLKNGLVDEFFKKAIVEPRREVEKSRHPVRLVNGSNFLHMGSKPTRVYSYQDGKTILNTEFDERVLSNEYEEFHFDQLQNLQFVWDSRDSTAEEIEADLSRVANDSGEVYKIGLDY